jgi:hypothetical protein
MDSIKALTKMTKQELYNEVKESRIIIQKYKELEEQVESIKLNLKERVIHIQNLQDENNELIKKCDSLIDRNIKLEGELVDVLNHPCSNCAINSMKDPPINISQQIYDDILKLYKDKINKFDQLENENNKYKKILKGIYDSMDGHALLFTQ